jgi:hypothetical protein
MQFVPAFILTLHLAWILWVIFGAFWTRRRHILTTFHLLSLAWGIVVELSPLPCPLTLMEQSFAQKAGTGTYGGGFLAHYLDRIVYPDLPESALVIAGVTICVLNLLIYFWRLYNWRSEDRVTSPLPR